MKYPHQRTDLRTHRRTYQTAVAAFFAATAFSASATTMRPGLWEMNSKVQAGSSQTATALVEAQKQLANLPPEQRKMLQEMLARQGMGMALSGDGVKLTYCMSKEMAERRELPTGQQGKCTSTSTPTATGMNVSFQCAEPPSSGTGQVTLQGDSAYTMRMNVTSMARGKPDAVTVESTGRWLGADCGGKAPAK